METTQPSGRGPSIRGSFVQGLRESPQVFFAPLVASLRWLGRIEARLSRSEPPRFRKAMTERTMFSWADLRDREQAVWAAVYASCWEDPEEAVRRADLAVKGLRLSEKGGGELGAIPAE